MNLLGTVTTFLTNLVTTLTTGPLFFAIATLAILSALIAIPMRRGSWWVFIEVCALVAVAAGVGQLVQALGGAGGGFSL